MSAGSSSGPTSAKKPGGVVGGTRQHELPLAADREGLVERRGVDHGDPGSTGLAPVGGRPLPAALVALPVR